MKQKFSKFLTLNIQDLLKGAVMFAIVGLVGSVLAIVNDGRFPTMEEFKAIGAAALTAFVSYLLKNLFTPVPKIVEIDPKQTDIMDERTKKLIG